MAKAKKAKKKTAKPAMKKAAKKWPTERAVMFRPQRLKYVRQIIKTNGCVFCEAAGNGVNVESLVLFKSHLAMVVMNKYPYNPGHLLILPMRHIGDFLTLSKEETAEISDLITRSVKAINATSQPAGYNVGLNLGSAAGAGIPEHLHYHIVPRWKGDTNFFPLLAETKVVVETLEQTFERLLPYFKGRE